MAENIFQQRERNKHGIFLKTHGMYGTKFYNTYRRILQRTSDKNCPKYKDYGGRGISCEWKSFDEFKKDMIKEYKKACASIGEKNISIERINNDGNYCKENCKWIKFTEQAKNRRNNTKIYYDNVLWNIGELENKYNITRNLIQYRIKRGQDIESIINYYSLKKYAR